MLGDGSVSGSLAITGEWRKREEIRRYCRNATWTFGVSQQRVFEAWKFWARSKAALAGKARPRPKEFHIVCNNLVGRCDGNKLLAETTLFESLYDSRVASAERLLAFMVMLYEAVRPLSKLPMVSYEMDRSESRLRVASTPAPIAFVEKLPPKGSRVAGLAAVKSLHSPRTAASSFSRNGSPASNEDLKDCDKRSNRSCGTNRSIGTTGDCYRTGTGSKEALESLEAAEYIDEEMTLVDRPLKSDSGQIDDANFQYTDEALVKEAMRLMNSDQVWMSDLSETESV
eukprot:TRINITY_DN14000_c0_g1_i2.p1 TRINITY_DN14000_c0_g1~~TRINITY_DN14000_c0_g1_i2.p1  ORF type:complete len:285 (-),score=38.05 TRINITY_DN14000_c0_g1_i2:147-1001(-)